MLHDIAGNLGDAVRGTDHFLKPGQIALAAFDRSVVPFDQFLGKRVEFRPFRVCQTQLQLCQPRSVVDRHRRVVGNRLGHVIGVDHLAKDGARVAVFDRNRRSSETNKGGVRQSLAKILGETDLVAHATIADDEALLETILGPMSLVRDHHHVAPGGQERMFAVLAPELLDGREDKPADIDLQQAAHVGGAVRLLRVPRSAEMCALKVPNSWSSRSLRSVRSTIVGFFSAFASWSWRTKKSIVRDLPDPLSVPNNATLASARSSPAASNSGCQCLPYRVKLVIAGDLFRLHDAVDNFESDVINDKVQKPIGREYTADHHL